MSERRSRSEGQPEQPKDDAGDLSDLLQEVRILQQGAQVLTAFLVIIPFDVGFAKIDQIEKWIYMATFVCSAVSLVLFSAPAVQHRVERPLLNHVRFKRTATRTILAGAAALSCAVVLATLLVASEVLGQIPGVTLAVVVALLICTTWWLVPLMRRSTRSNATSGGCT